MTARFDEPSASAMSRQVYDILGVMAVEQGSVLDALKVVRDPDLQRDIVSLGFIKNLTIDGGRGGVIDGDIYGPNVPIMLGMKTQLTTDGKKIVPAEKFGLQVISMGFLTGDDAPIIWRGPMLHGALQQFFREVAWTNLDYLIVDLPPGTGDVALSLSQTVPVAGAIVVTTPQQVSLADTRRAIAMYKKLNIPPLGIIENMSHFVCANCRHEADIFGHGGGEQMATDFGIPFLGRIPIYQPIREGSDAGVPLMISEPDSPSGQAFMAAAERTAAQVSIASFNRPTIQLTVVK